jgi:hypothetical protein
MSVSYLPPDVLKKTVIELIQECRKTLKAGGAPKVSQVESSVRAYCESIAALPPEEAKTHKSGLKELMQLVSELGDELKVARDTVKEELKRLDNMRKAHAAYKNIENTGPKKKGTPDD